MNDILERAQGYKEHALYLGYGHYKAGKLTAYKHAMLGVPVIICTSIVGTSIFATLSENPAIIWKVAAGLISLVATVLAALQTFFKLSELSAKHKLAGAEYGTLRRKIDMFLLHFSDEGENSRKNALDELREIAENLGRLAKESPDLADELYDEGKRQFIAIEPVANTVVDSGSSHPS